MTSLSTQLETITRTKIQNIGRNLIRLEDSNKGTFGHAVIIAGSYGEIGAAVLTVISTYRSGAGKVTAYVPQCGYYIVQEDIPEALVITDSDPRKLTKVPEELDQYNVAAIGPGIGLDQKTEKMVISFLELWKKPLVIDADALNILARHPKLLQSLPEGTILTPHQKEFATLFGGDQNNREELIGLQLKNSKDLNCIIILKGHDTTIAMPDGELFENPTGSPALATAGTGDVLTGILTGLLAQGLSSLESSIIGVYLHGLAGEIAEKKGAQQSVIASDVIDNIPHALHNILLKK